MTFVPTPGWSLANLLRYFEGHELHKGLSKVITDWLTDRHRTPDDVIEYSLGAKATLPDDLGMPDSMIPTYDFAVTFKDETEEKAIFKLWRGIWLHD